MTYRDPRTRCDRTLAWSLLHAHYRDNGQHFDARHALAHDPQRVPQFGQQAPYVFADLSKNHIDAHTETLLLQLAHECGFTQYRDAMFAGQPINNTEQRAAMHWLLRAPPDSSDLALRQPLTNVHTTLDAMLDMAERIRTNSQITDIVHIGIGGSGLGPEMVVQALHDRCQLRQRLHFISNVDGMELGSLLPTLRPEHTLFLIASKTFTTRETMTNAAAARAWFDAQGGRDRQNHFCALTANRQAATQWGMDTIFDLWCWVGGRYSLWSSIGLPIAIAVGGTAFRQLLAGAHTMDQHFRTAPLAHNLPVRLGLLDVWYRNFHGYTSRCIAPYSHGLRRLPAYLQQLEMESNGKGLDAQGRPLPYATAPAIWGEPGTNGQHAFFQMIHQGPDVIPVEFIAFTHPGSQLPCQHPRLLANALAQARALLTGQSHGFSGNRPSTFLLLKDSSPASLGALLALYEHRVFTSGAIWGINSFDQCGVELGKAIAADIETRLTNGNTSRLDASTAALMERACHSR